MKALQDAIATRTTAGRLSILQALSAKEYPALLKAVEETRALFGQESSSTYQLAEGERNAVREAVDQKIDCLDLAEMVASLDKKKLACQPRATVLLCSEVVDLLTASLPAWLPQQIHGSGVEVILRYSHVESIPRPPKGHSYYRDLAAHIFVKGEGMADGIRRFLKDNRVILETDMLRIVGRLWVSLYYKYISKEDRRLCLSSPYLGHEAGVRFAESWTEANRPHSFIITKVMAPLFSDGDFKFEPLLQAILETIADSEALSTIELHNDIAFAPEQCLKFQSNYFSLLSSPHRSVTKFAIDEIAAFAGLAGFDALAFISRMGAIFSHVSNPLQIAGLKVVKVVAKQHPQVATQIPASISSALLNPFPKVQKAVLDVLNALPEPGQKRIPEALLPFSEHVIPSLRTAYEIWLGQTDVPIVPIQSRSVEFSTALGDRLIPLTSLNELPFVASELLSKKAEPMRLELFLDGLARFAAADRSKLATAFGAMEERARHVVLDGGRNGFSPSWVEVLCARLILHFGPDPSVLVAAAQSFKAPPDTSTWPVAVGGFDSSRIAELIHGVDHGRASPPLATPEFTHGFIASDTLAARLRALVDEGAAPLHFDFIQAIARCHPGGGEVPHGVDEASRVLRYRLTGELDGPIAKPAWWLAVARSREPDGDFSEHPQFAAFHVEGQSDWTNPAIWRDLPAVEFDEWDGLNARKYINWSDPNRCEELLYNHNEIPADHLYPQQHTLLGSDPFRIRWRYSATPGFLDAVIAEDIHHTFYMWSATGRKFIDSAAAVMGELASRRPPLRHTMQVHLLLALNSPGQAEREAAVDIFLQASEDGRLADATSGLGVIFRQLLIAARPHRNATMQQITEKSRPLEPILQLGRIIPSLRQLSTQGPLIQTQLRDMLLTALDTPLSSVPKGFPSLLEMLLDLVIAHPPTQKIDLNKIWCGNLDGKSKTLATKIAKASTL